MAVVVPRSLLTDEQIGNIKTYLFFQPKEPFYNKGGNQRFYIQQETKDPIFFYLVDQYNFILPYAFTSVLLGYQPNIKIDYPILPKNIEFKGKLRDYQINVVNEAIAHLNNYGSTLLNLYTGAGKTILGAYLGVAYQHYICVLIPRTILAPQWKKTFQDFTSGIITWIVGDELCPPIFPHVTICMDTRVSQLPMEYRSKIGMLIVDEGHMMCTPGKVGSLLSFFPRYLIYETASPERPDDLHKMIDVQVGTHSIVLKCPKKVQIYKMNTGIEFPVEQNKRGDMDWSKMIKSVVNHDIRNKMIVSLCQQNINEKILVFSRLQDHVKLLHSMLEANGVKTDWMCGVKKNYKDSRVLVATIDKLGTGFDEQNSCPDFSGMRITMVILTVSVKGMIPVTQLFGRGLRSDFPKFIDLVDVNAVFKRHYRERKKYYDTLDSEYFEINLLPEDKKYVKTKDIDGNQIEILI